MSLKILSYNCENNCSVGKLYTIRFQLEGDWKTPFWKEEIALDAFIKDPFGHVYNIPGFYTADCSLEKNADDKLRADIIGKGEWQIRFVPEYPGLHDIVVKAIAKNSQTEEKQFQISVKEGIRRPFIRVSTSDPHYFEFDDGKPYFANGENICWYHAHQDVTIYDEWFRKLSENGGNFARVHLCRWCFGFEWGKAGEYRLDRAWEVDYVLALAEKYGIYIKLCSDWFRELEPDNPYRLDNGGPCKSMRDIFTDDTAKRMWKNRLRYMVARWGYSPNIMAWELWDEIDCVTEYNNKIVDKWEKEMAQYLHSIDAWGRMVTSSLGCFGVDHVLWSMDEINFTHIHSYYNTVWYSGEFGKDMVTTVINPLPLLRSYNKPLLIGEFGITDASWYEGELEKVDPKGIAFHNVMWAGVMAGVAGTPHIWGWSVYVNKLDLWHMHKTIASFINGIEWNREQFVPFEGWASDENVRVLALHGKNIILVWIQNKKHTWWNVYNNIPVPQLHNIKVYIPLQMGVYTAEIWDTYKGKAIKTQELGEVMGEIDEHANRKEPIIEIDMLENDVAVKIFPRN